MKALFIGQTRVREIDLLEHGFDEEFLKLMSEFKILESHIIIFGRDSR